jgi:beta-glucosidase
MRSGIGFSRKIWLAAVVVAVGGAGWAQGARAADAGGQPAYRDLSLTFEQRAADLVSRMTLEEKGEQMQEAIYANNRLGIPAVNWWSEALHGVGRAGTATIFPEAIGMGATWDPAIVKKIAEATADEARAKFDPLGARYRGIILWCPTVNMARDPRWGRVEETFGEDPWLTSRIGVAFVKGLQGDDPKYLKTVATPKHFAMHSQETGRMFREFDCPETVLRDYYFPAFRACFVEGKAASTMAAHSGINKVPCTANKWLLTDVLRKEWGFEGAVVSDWSGVTQLMNGHHYVDSEEEAVAAAVNAGLDVICDPRPKGPVVVRAVQQHLLTMEALDRALTRNMVVRFRLGMFDPPDKVPFTKIPDSVVGCKEHIELALQSARESIVLMKNDVAPKGYGFEKLLPLDLRRIDSIAVLGPYANVRQFGAYSAPTPAGPSPTILDSLRKAVGDRVQINTADWGNSEACIRMAAKSTVAIVVLGLNNQIEREGVDRQTLDLPLDQTALLERVVRANPLTVAVLEGGSPFNLKWMKEHVPAIVNVWYPGEQGGNATAEVLLGEYNPAGRLPLTYYGSTSELPRLEDYDITNGRTYMYLKKPPVYPFGHGLSYTDFTYGALRAPATAGASSQIEVTLTLTNNGPRDGDEVVQLYVRKVDGAPKSPSQQLKGFARVTLRKGASGEVRLPLGIEQLGMWDQSSQKYVVDPGAYELRVGASSEDIRQRATITIQ